MNRFTHRKPDPLTLLAIGVGLAALMTSAVADAEPFYKQSSFSELGMDLADGQLMLAPMGRQGAGLHMSYQATDDRSVVHAAGSSRSFEAARSRESSSAVFLSVQVPW